MNPELADSTLSGKVCWFHFTSLLLAGGVLLMEFTTRKSRFIFSLPDALLLLLFGIVLVSYDKDENLQPERFLFIAQLVALWFMLRGALQAHQELRPFFITIIIFTGIVPAIWGISHSIDPAPITHPVFRLLETSLKPEPFYGYIAVIFPVCLNTLLRFKNCDKIALWESRTFLFYFSILGATLIITALLFKTDQPVWMAAALTCILFYGQKDTYYSYKEWKTLQELYHDQAYEQAASRYTDLFVQLYHRTDFLYEGAECFYKTGQHDIAIKWLDRALKLSAAPELYYAIAENEEAIKQYRKAESYLLEISRILPEHGYTYFLLAKLYTHPSFSHPDKFHKAAKRFLAFQPSTQNNITKEMKEEILQIIRNWDFGK